MRKLERAVHALSHWAAWVAVVALALMMVLTTCDVIWRYFGHPIRGAWEVVAYSLSVMSGFGLAYTQVQRLHIRAVFILERLPQRTQAIIDAVMYLISTAFFILVVWQFTVFGNLLSRSTAVTETLGFSIVPFVYGAAFGCLLMCLELFVDFCKSLVQGKRR